jgi:hypothetical protein
VPVTVAVTGGTETGGVVASGGVGAVGAVSHAAVAIKRASSPRLAAAVSRRGWRRRRSVERSYVIGV